jgi:hypothetical protein
MFRRKGRHCVAYFDEHEAKVLRQCAASMAAMLSDLDRDDPAVMRLFPDVYPEDPDEAAEFRRFTEDDLKASKLEHVTTILFDLLESGGEVRLNEEAADRWLRALTDVRLTLGTRLGVEDETDIETELDEAVLQDPTSVRVGQLSVYGFLTLLQESLVAALSR